MPPPCSYILPLRSEKSLVASDLTGYLRWLAPRAETIIVDASPPDVFAHHARAWGAFARHMSPAPDLVTPMGKVGSVLTGLRHASSEHVIVADDDVRYDEQALARMNEILVRCDVVRPQNYFAPLPWYAAWDSGRTLLNRVSGGDWPGTLGVRRSILETHGYDGRAMFENLELVRTVRAAGGREEVPLDLFVARRPSTAAHFWSQRVRQAYDEFARPGRMLVQLALLPALILATLVYGASPSLALAAVAVLMAEVGRRRGNGTRVFPARTSWFAPAWLAERAICSWMALGSRAVFGGVRYRGRLLRHAATPMHQLRARHARAGATEHRGSTPRSRLA